MARDFHISRLPIQRSFFGDPDRAFEILCKDSDMKDLVLALRGVLSHGKSQPITSFEQDVLCDLYNSLSLINLK